MGIIPVDEWSHFATPDNRNGLVDQPEQAVRPEVIDERTIHLWRLRDQDSCFLERAALDSRVIIVEGISGSGKDTLQMYLKKKLKHRDVYDYSEGEVLNSWKQFQIEGIFELRIKLMKGFLNYVRDTVSRDENAVFLLNRFHLSAYVFTIIQQPNLETEYEEIINILRTLPVHVLMLQLEENEIPQRTLHPERSGAWRKFQQQIAQREGFRGKLERYISQQRLMLEAAKRQQIPYSVIKLSLEHEIGDGQVRISKAPSIVRRGMRMNAADARISKTKRHLPPTV